MLRSESRGSYVTLYLSPTRDASQNIAVPHPHPAVHALLANGAAW